MSTAFASRHVRKAYLFGLDMIKKQTVVPPLAAYYLAEASRAGYSAARDSRLPAQAYKIAFVGMFELYLPATSVDARKFYSDTLTIDTNHPEFVKAYEKATQLFTENSSELDRARSTPYLHINTWLPTPPAFLPPLLPGFGYLRTRAGLEVDVITESLRPFSTVSPEFEQQMEFVFQIGGRNSTIRSVEQTSIAHFWAGGPGTVTPPGMWTMYSLSAMRRTGMSLRESAKFMLTISNALLDAAIACWNMKYKFDVLRPITAIRNSKDIGWESLLTTPPFPSYTSGHSTFSMAAATILDQLTPIQNHVVLSSEGYKSRRFTSYETAANEAGMSRIYGGIHFEMDNVDGKELGRRIACHYLHQYWSQKCD